LPPDANPTSMALSADGSELGFVDSSAEELGPPAVSYTGAAWVLSTGARPGSAFSRGTKVYHDSNGTAVSIALSSDGQTAYVTANAGPGTVLAAYRTSTGTMLGTLHSWPFTQLTFAGLAIGGDALVTWDDFHPSAYRVSLATGQVTPFRLYAKNGQPAADIAWLSPAVTPRRPSGSARRVRTMAPAIGWQIRRIFPGSCVNVDRVTYSRSAQGHRVQRRGLIGG
jgi:hypothetical protein